MVCPFSDGTHPFGISFNILLTEIVSISRNEPRNNHLQVLQHQRNTATTNLATNPS
jgi:hypothetical protein